MHAIEIAVTGESFGALWENQSYNRFVGVINWTALQERTRNTILFVVAPGRLNSNR